MSGVLGVDTSSWLPTVAELRAWRSDPERSTTRVLARAALDVTGTGTETGETIGVETTVETIGTVTGTGIEIGMTAEIEKRRRLAKSAGGTQLQSLA